MGGVKAFEARIVEIVSEGYASSVVTKAKLPREVSIGQCGGWRSQYSPTSADSWGSKKRKEELKFDMDSTQII